VVPVALVGDRGEAGGLGSQGVEREAPPYEAFGLQGIEILRAEAARRSHRDHDGSGASRQLARGSLGRDRGFGRDDPDFALSGRCQGIERLLERDHRVDVRHHRPP
jgi:hypothetical protein